jgi:aminoglycoside phosphotransferase
MTSAIETVMDRGRPLRLERLLGPGTRTVTVASSRDPNAKVTVLLFRAGASAPSLVVKIPTTIGAAVAVDTEADMLGRLGARLDAPLLDTVPRVVDRLPTRCGDALVTTALPGRPLTIGYHRWLHVQRLAAVARDFDVAGRWLARVHDVSGGPRRPVDFVGPLTVRMDLRFAGAPLLGRVLEHLDGVDRRLRAEVAPRTVVHGDYWAGNVLTDGTTVTGVVDWEAGLERGSPVRDVARFALSYGLCLDRHTRGGRAVAGHPGLRAGAWGAGLHYAVDGSGWFPRLVRTFTTSHLERLGIRPERWRDVLVAGVADCAASADDDAFARHHYDVLAAMVRRGDDSC